MTAPVSLIATVALAAVVYADAPALVRLPLALLVFLAAPGWAFFGRGRADVDALVAARVVGLSVAVDLLVAEALLVAGHLTVGWFLAVDAAVIVVAGIGRRSRGSRQSRAEEVPA
ncbi:MAG: hypothetical protein QOJ79_606 [Actinomycetota bacterium]|jgi:hypothetical protein|nr:hypothetical protein [Actinomycetota bacterium]